MKKIVVKQQLAIAAGKMIKVAEARAKELKKPMVATKKKADAANKLLRRATASWKTDGKVSATPWWFANSSSVNFEGIAACATRTGDANTDQQIEASVKAELDGYKSLPGVGEITPCRDLAAEALRIL